MKMSVGRHYIYLDLGDMRDPEEAAIKWSLAQRLIDAWNASSARASE